MTTAATARSPDRRELDDIALFRHCPQLCESVPWKPLGQWPTPVDPLPCPERVPNGASIFVKREDVSDPDYGGNKIRTLEAHFGQAQADGCDRIWATGAYGSNHTLASVTQAPRAHLRAGVVLFWQPRSRPALANLSATLAHEPQVVDICNPTSVPQTVATLRGRRRDGPADYLMPPGGANETGAMGHVSAALELCEQIEAGDCPLPKNIVLALGSGCTTAGLLVGFALAARLGFVVDPGRLPHIHAISVTPWPITARRRILNLAEQTASRVSELLGLAIATDTLSGMLTIDHRHLGWGYGVPTRAGRRALETMKMAGGPCLDLVYSAKAAAALFELASRDRGPNLFWASKSTAPLAIATADQVALAPTPMRLWLQGRR